VLNTRTTRAPDHHGVLRSVAKPTRTLVVGGGIAGLAAATALAERGVQVTVVETLDYLGGRAGSWDDTHADGSTFQQDRGFHAFFRQYYNLRNLIRRISPDLSVLRELPDYPVIAPDGAVETFADVPHQPVANFLGLIHGSTTFKFRHLLRANIRIGLSMVGYAGERSFARWDGMTAKAYLDKVHLPPKPRAMLFDVFAHSFFNPEEEMSAAEMLQYFHFYFMGNPEGLAFDTLDQPLSHALWNPLRSYLEERGATFLLGTSVAGLARRQDAGGAGWDIDIEELASSSRSTVQADAVVLAANVPGLKAIVQGSPDLGTPQWRSDIAALRTTAPYAVLRLWFDGDVDKERAPFVSISGAGILDSVGLYHRITEPEALWAATTGGSIIELHAYAVPASHHGDEERILRDLLSGLHTLYPETASLNEVDRRFHVMQDCPAFPINSWERRPRIRTPHESLVLAGDLCWVPFPCGLMERATASGFLAANALLANWNVRGETLESVPPQGILSGVFC